SDLMENELLLKYATLLAGDLIAYGENHPSDEEPKFIEVFDIELYNLTQEEVDAIMKLTQKAKTKGTNILVHKTAKKEIGTKSKAIVVWPFESASMQVNGEPILYKTQLNEDGSLSCNCMGWTRGSAKNTTGRFCKHTNQVKIEAEMLYKQWKKTGTIGGENFEVVSASAVNSASSKTLSLALKEKPAQGDIMFKAKR